MEYCEGWDLKRLISRKGQALDPYYALQFALDAAEGLEHAHECDVIHRDIKPSNLMYVADIRRIKILDFGLARADKLSLDAHESTAAMLTPWGHELGTPHFMSPEQTYDSHSVDERADIYSLGATMYYMLTATPPYSDIASSTQLHRMLRSGPVPNVRLLRRDIAPSLAEVVSKMMAKRPDHRQASMREVRLQLQACRDDLDLMDYVI